MSKPRKAVIPSDSRATEERIATYLRQHPDFLVRFPDLLDRLAAPSRSRGDGVVDMQAFLIERLQAQVLELKGQQEALVAGSRDYLASQNHMHAAATLLLRATTLEHLVQIVTIDWLGGVECRRVGARG